MRSAKIGFLNQIIVATLSLENKASIHKMNRIKNINVLELGLNAEIRSGNFIGAPAKGTLDDAIKFSNQNIFIAENSSILRSNYFDVVDEISIGINVVFGGNGSEIWTHGFTVNREMLAGKVKFGNNIFIGSNCIFTKGVTITNNVTIGPGSVIYKSITESGIYSSHEIRKVK
jgi:acetyltransferase-like isoleucine patch superfamily enzyme